MNQTNSTNLMNTIKQNFIITTDDDTANALRKCGFKEIPATTTIFTFVNEGKLTFSNDIDINKIKYSNKLFI